jgi:hypothetical protein
MTLRMKANKPKLTSKYRARHASMMGVANARLEATELKCSSTMRTINMNWCGPKPSPTPEVVTSQVKKED